MLIQTASADLEEILHAILMEEETKLRIMVEGRNPRCNNWGQKGHIKAERAYPCATLEPVAPPAPSKTTPEVENRKKTKKNSQGKEPRVEKHKILNGQLLPPPPPKGKTQPTLTDTNVPTTSSHTSTTNT